MAETHLGLFACGTIYGKELRTQAGGARHANSAKCIVRFNKFGAALRVRGGGGGAEALYYASVTIEVLAAIGAMGPKSVIDVDLVNCFPSIERKTTTHAYDKELTSMGTWDVWADSEEVEV